MSRQIKDIKDKNTGQLIYPKSHAKATYMSNGQTVEDAINNKGSKDIKFTDVVASNWVSDNTYLDFPYRCDITCGNVTSEDYAEVIFALEQAISGEYAPICETEDNIVSIWSKSDEVITIPVIIIQK